LHGDEDGSVDRGHRLFGGPVVEMDAVREEAERRLMDQAPYLLDADRRAHVLESLGENCAYHGWILLAAHVRSTHVHAVVDAGVQPEKILSVFKAYASRRLTLGGFDAAGRKRWSRHGSTRWLWTDDDVRSAIQYVVDEQGEAMAVFIGAGAMDLCPFEDIGNTLVRGHG
jgi:REP element-mobilizing transposase RayT